jgi:peptide/nickel transport system permease protein
MTAPELSSTDRPGSEAFSRRDPLPQRLRRSRPFVAGAALTGLILLLVLFGPLALPSTTAQDPAAFLAGPSGSHLLGTDQLGRDLLARLVSAGRTDLRIAVVALLFPALFGVLVGTLAGYFGGWLDAAVLRLVDVVVAFPFYVLIIALVFVVGPGESGIYTALALVGWVGYARITRNATAVTAAQDWVVAARQGGLPTSRVLLRHVLPHTATQAVVLFASDIVVVIVAVITLGYLGLGVAPPTPDWGTMIYESRSFITSRWWLPALPGFAVVLTGLGFSLLGDGIADVWRVRR